ncbi:MAG: type II toxin-antitoxin system RelE/ParE family toxin [Candidatus Omnitrophota bacterium]
MSGITCYYFETASGRLPAKEFVDSLDMKSRQKFFFVKGLLESFGRRLPQPHAKYLGDDIFELRFHVREGAARVLYFFFAGNGAIFTNGFLKKTDRTPPDEKRMAVERRRMFLAGR